MGGKGAAGWGSLLSGTYSWPTVTLLTMAAQITPSKSFKSFKQRARNTRFGQKAFIWRHKKNGALWEWRRLPSRCTSSLWDYMAKSSVIMCDSQVKYITWLCRRAKGRYSGQPRGEGEAGGVQQHSRLAQPNTHVCMKLECQHLIHAAGWWLWNKLCQRVAAEKIPLGCSRQWLYEAEVTAGCRFWRGFIYCDETFQRDKFKGLSVHIQAWHKKKDGKKKMSENIFGGVFSAVFLSCRRWNLSSLMEVGVVKKM